jgi:phosphoribosylaminoimidazole-succinocarboxamide synthase
VNTESPSATFTAGYAGGMDIPGWELFYKGKVRDLYRQPGDEQNMLMIATDRLSAFDVVMAECIPDRGKILTHITEYWCKEVADQVKSARITCVPEEVPGLPPECYDALRGRMTYTRIADRVNVEIVLRSYLAGSGWREYQTTGKLWEFDLPEGLQNSSKLPEVLLTPTTKAEKDEPITWQEAKVIIDNDEAAETIRKLAFAIFNETAERTAQKGVLLADTKFEFGICDGELVLIDEVMTPDCSRYWPANKTEPGNEPQSWDKEIVRAYLRSLSDWNRQAPPPPIPAAIVQKTRYQYLEICQILTGGLPEGLSLN